MRIFIMKTGQILFLSYKATSLSGKKKVKNARNKEGRVLTQQAAEALCRGRARGAVGRQAIGSPHFKPQSWSGARETAVEMERLFKAVTPRQPSPKKEAVGPLLRFLLFAVEEVFGKAD